jgi:glycosyltransferase involved in cell wall biosynthesis
MPNVVLETMACGVPLVATNVGAVEEMVGRSGAPAVIPAADPAAIAQAVVDLLGHPERAREMGSAGRERVREAFSPARQGAQLRALYEELIPGMTTAPFAIPDSASLSSGRG